MLCSRIHLLTVVFTVILRTCKALNEPTACELPQCSCNTLKLTCACTARNQFLELKQDGYGYIPSNIVTIRVENCESVLVFQQSIEKVRSLRGISLKNIAKLTLHEKSFSWEHKITNQPADRTDRPPGITIEIVNSNISKIPSNAFAGRINTIYLEGSRINNIEAFAFSNLDDIVRLKIKDCLLENLEQHSFKKFEVDYFVIEGGIVGVMNSYAIRDLTVRKGLRLERVDFGVVKTLAVNVDGPMALHITGCAFKLLESEAFKINTRGPVFIDDNIVRDLRSGAFVGITLDSRFHAHNDKQDLIFENNTITKITAGALVFNTTGLNPKLDRLVLNVKCSCDDIKNWQTKIVKYQGHQQTLTPDIMKQTWCKDGTKELTFSQYYDKKCKMNNATLYLIIGLSVGGIAIIVLCVAAFIMYRKWKKMYKAVKTSRELINENRLSTYSNTSNHVIVLPPPKMYLETEIDDCNEEVQPLKHSQNDVSKLKVSGL